MALASERSSRVSTISNYCDNTFRGRLIAERTPSAPVGQNGTQQAGEEVTRPSVPLDLSFRISNALALLLYRHHVSAEVFVLPQNLSGALHLICKLGYAPLVLPRFLPLLAPMGLGPINGLRHGESSELRFVLRYFSPCLPRASASVGQQRDNTATLSE
jgi:hypothetical protein